MNTRITVAACIVALIAPALAQAQSYPSRPVMVIVPTVAGNVTDKETRIWTGKLAENLGQSFVVDNRGGAGGTIAARAVAQAKPDGHTLGMVILNITQQRLRFKDLPFDPIESFEFISLLNERSGLIMVHASLPISNIKEYIAYARVNPGKLNMAASGEGTNDHFAGVMLMKATNTELNFIHYKNSSVGYADFLAGRLHIMSIPYDAGGAYASFVKTGKARNIGTTTSQRSPMDPNMPTLQEQGVAGYEMGSLLGIYATGKTPASIIGRLHGEIVKIGKTPDLRKQIGDGSIIVTSTPQEFKRKVLEHEDRFRKLAQELNIDMRPD